MSSFFTTTQAEMSRFSPMHKVTRSQKMTKDDPNSTSNKKNNFRYYDERGEKLIREKPRNTSYYYKLYKLRGNKGIKMKEISKMWKNETPKIKNMFKHYAKERKKECKSTIKNSDLDIINEQTCIVEDSHLEEFFCTIEEITTETNGSQRYSEQYDYTGPVITQNIQQLSSTTLYTPCIAIQSIPYEQILTQQLLPYEQLLSQHFVPYEQILTQQLVPYEQLPTYSTPYEQSPIQISKLYTQYSTHSPM
ncbi:18012_t:CDS:2 [Acaulospora morrowiae]|uniref:18012_t:CDS:1 n=1 Tax=Acaulospora morrowiae TaxID=94023 RepID=A0A9N8YV34_9GLOM|nr:18012_t:CDS:2 [Acaulospora morrowiae]